SFGGRSVSRNSLPRAFYLLKSPREIVNHCPHARTKVHIVVALVSGQLSLALQECTKCITWVIISFHEETQRPPMNRGVLQVIQKKAMFAEEAFQCGHREVTQMLMINGIEFAMLDEINQVGDFDHENSALFEKQRNPINETTKVCDVCEDVVGEEYVRPL